MTSAATLVEPTTFAARAFDASLLRSFEQVLANEQSQRELVVDARPAPRFLMQVDEPRPNLRRGTIAGSRNVPAASVVDADGLLRSDAELRALFEQAGAVDASRAMVVSCGSGANSTASRRRSIGAASSRRIVLAAIDPGRRRQASPRA